MKLATFTFDDRNKFIVAENCTPPPAWLTAGFYAHRSGAGGWLVKHGHPQEGEHGLTIYPGRNSDMAPFASAEDAVDFLERQGL